MADTPQQLTFLIGFMGAGKTTMGKALGLLPQFTYLDLDDIIEEQTGKAIPDMFQEHGENYFRQKEREALESLLDLPAGQYVIACGGGTPCYLKNMEWLNAHGITFYLKPHIGELVKRLLPQKAYRPMISKVKDEELATHIQGLLAIREPYYLQAHHVLEGTEVDEAYMISLLQQSMHS